MDDPRERAKGAATLSGRISAGLSSAGTAELLRVVTALNLVRMNLGMYPPGHSRITESIDHAFDIIKKSFGAKNEQLIGFAGDTVSFGETVPELLHKHGALQEYARCLNHLRIVSFTFQRGLQKEELREFSRILAAKPADIWAMGKIESTFIRAGIRGIKVKVMDADHFRLGEKTGRPPTGIDHPGEEELFWRGFLARLHREAGETNPGGDATAQQRKLSPAEAVGLLNKARQQWPSAVLDYEKLVQGYFSDMANGGPAGAETVKALAGVHALITDLHADLKKQLLDVVERQLAAHSDAALTAESLKCFPREIFLEMIGRANDQGSQISPALVNLLKKMTGIEDGPAPTDREKDKEVSAADTQTLLNREKYEDYVPADYDQVLKRAATTPSSQGDRDEAPFPLPEHLKTLNEAQIDFQICRLVHPLMDGQIKEEEYALCARKLARSIPELLKGGRFPFLTALMETLRRHLREKPLEPIRQNALALLRSLSDKETIARQATPLILQGMGKPEELKAFLLSSGAQNLTWLFDLYLDPRAPVSSALTDILKGFGTTTTEEAVKRLPGRDSQSIIRLLALIREMADRSSVPAVRNLSRHEDWTVRREVIRTLIEFDDPSAIGLLRKSLKAENRQEVLDAVSLACRYRLGDLLDDVTALLKTLVIGKEAALFNEWIVGELAKSKNPAVIPHLERIAAARLTLSPSQLAQTKIVLYRHLHLFPKKQIRKLLRTGSRSPNQEIRRICAKITKQSKE